MSFFSLCNWLNRLWLDNWVSALTFLKWWAVTWNYKQTISPKTACYQDAFPQPQKGNLGSKWEQSLGGKHQILQLHDQHLGSWWNFLGLQRLTHLLQLCCLKHAEPLFGLFHSISAAFLGRCSMVLTSDTHWGLHLGFACTISKASIPGHWSFQTLNVFSCFLEPWCGKLHKSPQSCLSCLKQQYHMDNVATFCF